MTRTCAEWACVWPDGATFSEGEDNWQPHTLTAGLTLPALAGADLDAWLRNQILDRANAIARQWGRTTGFRLDMSDYVDSDPDYWTISANVMSDDFRRAPSEDPGPPGLPWWIVRSPP